MGTTCSDALLTGSRTCASHKVVGVRVRAWLGLGRASKSVYSKSKISEMRAYKHRPIKHHVLRASPSGNSSENMLSSLLNARLSFVRG